jgi:hypothetical protein
MQAIELVLGSPNGESPYEIGTLNLVQTNKRKPFFYDTHPCRSLVIPVPNKLGNLQKDFKDTYKRVLEHYNINNLKDIRTSDLYHLYCEKFSFKHICRIGNITQI